MEYSGPNTSHILPFSSPIHCSCKLQLVSKALQAFTYTALTFLWYFSPAHFYLNLYLEALECPLRRQH